MVQLIGDWNPTGVSRAHIQTYTMLYAACFNFIRAVLWPIDRKAYAHPNYFATVKFSNWYSIKQVYFTFAFRIRNWTPQLDIGQAIFCSLDKYANQWVIIVEATEYNEPKWTTVAVYPVITVNRSLSFSLITFKQFRHLSHVTFMTDHVSKCVPGKFSIASSTPTDDIEFIMAKYQGIFHFSSSKFMHTLMRFVSNQ